MKRGLVFSIILALLIIPLISAYSYGSPLDYLNDEWVKFGIIFLLLFVSIYSFLNRKMQNAPVSVITAIGLSALISIPIMQRGLIEPFLSPDIIDWIVIVAIGIALIFLFYKFGMRIDNYGRKRFSLMRFIIFLGLLVFILYLIGDLIPDSILYGPIGDWIDIIRGLGITTITIIIVVLVVLWIISRMWRRRNLRLDAGATERGKRSVWGGGGSEGVDPRYLEKLRALERQRTADKIKRMRERYQK